jgi:uncharacterized protein (UPF0332 family)
MWSVERLEDIYLLFDKALESLEVSKLDIGGGYFDASVNRSYYAVFYAAKALLLKKGIETKKHSGTIHQFGLEYVIDDEFK